MLCCTIKKKIQTLPYLKTRPKINNPKALQAAAPCPHHPWLHSPLPGQGRQPPQPLQSHAALENQTENHESSRGDIKLPAWI